MAEFAPRESLYDRVDRLVRDRRVRMLFGLGSLAFLFRMYAYGLDLDSWLPFGIGLIAVIGCAAYAWSIMKRREKVGMAQRNATVIPLKPPTRWRQLDEALAGYRALTGSAPPQVGFVHREESGERIDAEIAFFATEPDENGDRPAVSPFSSVPATPICGFDEAMLDSYTAAELLAVLVHLVNRAEFARGPSARLANGVCEADSKALLLTREHVPLLRAIEKSRRVRKTAAPGMGSIRFADVDVRAGVVSETGVVKNWVVRDRSEELRAHLGALGLDAPRAQTESA